MIGKKNGKVVQAFTIQHEGKAREIISDAGVSEPFELDTSNRNDPRILNTKALWDTGATGCVVTKSVALALKLKPISVAKVGGLGGYKESNVYLVHLYLADNIVIEHVQVTEIADLGDTFGIIFGMNLINQGDFAISNLNNKTTISVRWPSLETFDFEKDLTPLDTSGIGKVGDEAL